MNELLHRIENEIQRQSYARLLGLKDMLIDTVRDFERHSWNSAQTRNWYVAGIADEIYFAPFDETSKLSPMHYHFNRYSNGNVKIL